MATIYYSILHLNDINDSEVVSKVLLNTGIIQFPLIIQLFFILGHIILSEWFPQQDIWTQKDKSRLNSIRNWYHNAFRYEKPCRKIRLAKQVFFSEICGKAICAEALHHQIEGIHGRVEHVMVVEHISHKVSA